MIDQILQSLNTKAHRPLTDDEIKAQRYDAETADDDKCDHCGSLLDLPDQFGGRACTNSECGRVS